MNRFALAAVMVGLFALAAAVRLYGINANPLWYDELCSVECSSGRGLEHETLPKNVLITSPIRLTQLAGAPSWLKIWGSLEREQHPPLYFIALRGWRTLFGDSEPAMRSLAMIAGCVGVVLLFDFGRLILGWRGVWPALMLALAGPVIDSSIQVRNYTPMMALVLLALVALVRIELFGLTRKRMALLGFGVLGAMLTHYFALGACGALLVYIAVRFRGSTRSNLLLLLLICAVVYAVTWGPFLLQQRANFATSQHYRDDSAPGHLARVLWRVALLPARWFSEPKSATWMLSMLAAVIYALPFLIIGRKPPVLLAVLVLDGSVGLVAGLDLFRSTNQTELLRYTIAAAPMIFFCIAAVLESARPWLQHSLPALAALSCVFDIPNAYHPWEGSYRNAAAILDSGMRDGDTIVFIGDWRGPGYGGWLFLGMGRYLHHWPQSAAIITEADPNLERQLATRQRVWVITAQGGTPLKCFPNAAYHGISGEICMADVGWLEWPRPSTTTAVLR